MLPANPASREGRGRRRALVSGLGALALPFLLAGLLLAAPPAMARDREPSLSEQLEEWPEGPVRYLITRTESRLYRRLESPQDRVAFIRRFWERRDPDPRTPRNEAREQFWQRVAEANSSFDDTAREGWRTDRGKIFILLGPPDDIERQDNYDAGYQTETARGVQRWIYLGLRHGPTGAATIIPFIRRANNDWYLIDDARLAAANFNLYVDPQATSVSALYGPLGGLSEIIDDLPFAGGRLGTAMDLGRVQEVPTERDLMKSVVRAEEFLGTIEGRARLDHPIAGPGDTLLGALTLALPRSQLDPPPPTAATELATRFVASAVLRPLESAALSEIEIPESAFVVEPEPVPGDPWVRLQALRPMPPGRWRLSAVVLDRKGGGAATIARDLVIEPVTAEAPLLSGPLLASVVSIAGDAAATGERPWHFAGNTVVPRMDPLIAHGERFKLFVQIDEPPVAPGPVALAWTIERRTPGEEHFAALGSGGSLADARGPRAWDFEAERFEPGHYRLRFVATSEAGVQTRRELAFEVVEERPALLPRERLRLRLEGEEDEASAGSR